MFLFANIIKQRWNQAMTNQFSSKMKENRTNSRNWGPAGWKISFLLPQKEHKWPNLLKINKLLYELRIYFRMARNPWEEMVSYGTENGDAWYTILSYAHFFSFKKNSNPSIKVITIHIHNSLWESTSCAVDIKKSKFHVRNNIKQK